MQTQKTFRGFTKKIVHGNPHHASPQMIMVDPLRDDIKSCGKISILNSFKIALPPPSPRGPAILNPNFPHQVNNNEKIYQSCQELLQAKVSGPSLCGTKLYNSTIKNMHDAVISSTSSVYFSMVSTVSESSHKVLKLDGAETL